MTDRYYRLSLPATPKEVALPWFLVAGAHHVRSLWALMFVNGLECAKSALAEREGIKADNIQKHIGCRSQTSESDGTFVTGIREWATQRALDGAVWTALPPKFEGTEGRVPTAAELVAFFRSLPYEKRRHAEEYVRRAPLQIDTESRRVIELELGWRPIVESRVME